MTKLKEYHFKAIPIFGSCIVAIIVLSLASNIRNVKAADPATNNPPQKFNSTPTPFPEISSYQDTATFTFEDLGWDDMNLYYSDTTSINVDLPNLWTVHSGSSFIDIYYDFEILKYFTGAELAPYVEVGVNGYFAGRFIPTVGVNQHYRVNIPYQSVVGLTEYSDNTNKELGITITFFDRDVNPCLYNGLLNIHAESLIEISFTPTQPYRGSWTFPYPLIQESFLSETLLFVIPDEYNDNDITAAMQLSAIIGASTSGNVTYKLLTASQVTDNDLNKSSAIVIGQPSKNTLIAELYDNKYLSTTNYSDGLIKFNGEPLDASYGYVHLIPSYVNNINSLLIVSGNGDEGVASAVRGIINSTIINNPISTIVFSKSNAPLFVELPLTGFVSSFAIIPPTADQPKVGSVSALNEYSPTFAELNFQSKIFIGTGEKDFTLQFYVPQNWIIQNTAKLLINYGYSSSIRPISSSFSISLNDIPIATAPFGDPTQGYTTSEVPINPEDILYGSINTIRFSLSHSNEDPCVSFNPLDYWAYIKDDSILYLPYIINTDLGEYILNNPFDHLSNESRVLFILPENLTSKDLNNILALSVLLGGNAISHQPLEIIATSKYDIEPDMYQDFNYLVYGTPSNNPFIRKINMKLPQGFKDGEDYLDPQTQPASIHIPQEDDIGLIQAITVDDTRTRGITIISGTSPQGIQYVMDHLKSIFEYKPGNLFYVNRNGVLTQNNIAIEKVEQDQITPQALEQGITIKPTATTSIRPTINPPGIPLIDRDLPNNSPIITYGILGLSLLVLFAVLIWHYGNKR